MPRKKKEETVEETSAEVAETEETAEVAAKAENAEKVEAKAETAEEKPENAEKTAKGKKKEAKSEDAAAENVRTSKRAEKVGVVWSDKMTKTVVVRVDRLVKHPIYRKYVRRKKKFMAHDELGSGIGDKVRIVETRPLSARKRWRVVEIIQKAEK